ncbi:type IV toxin-antitoxin system AbiEi family antitoxin [Microbacterium rhizophilus]|uniref:type IV toxin-antitoxin system AbiEi family antitoxin n=1 Tax=Microbacterium rhizophilus TaxID=3138934 RepID=UPI0031F10D9A
MPRVHFPHEILSPAELSAARLDGELAPIGDGFAPADALESPALRAASLRPLLGDGLVAIGLSAAWVHGALGLPPAVHHVQRGAHRVSRPVRRDIRFRDTPLDAADTVALGGVRVASPARTLVELAREASDAVSAGAARRLATPELVAEAHGWLLAHRRFPGRQPAMAFLARLAAAQDDVTR